MSISYDNNHYTTGRQLFCDRTRTGISLIHQMSFVCRYVVVEDKEVEVRKLFLCFITEHGETVYDIRKMILDRQEEEYFDFKKNYMDRI